MALYKFINEKNITRYNNFIIHEGVVYTNAKALPFTAQYGWKELQIDEVPSYDVETEELITYYEDFDDHIEQHWEVKDKEADIEDYQNSINYIKDGE